MRALTLNGYDGPSSLRFDDCPQPLPGPKDVVIEVHAASLNPVDARTTRGYLRGRVDFNLPHVLGRDCSGTVVEVGAEVEGFRPGDEVFAVADQKRWGTHAAQVAIDEATVATKPAALDHIQAASLPVAALSALTGIMLVGKLQKGERVLIHAGAGGVGSIAIQLAKHLGAFVATTTGPGNVNYVRDIGADLAVDYTKRSFSDHLEGYDLVFDVIGGDVRFKSFDVLRRGGRITHLSAPPMTQPAPRDDVTVVPAVVGYERHHLDLISALIKNGAIKPTVDKVFAFSDASQAYELIGSGHARGKIVLDMGLR